MSKLRQRARKTSDVHRKRPAAAFEYVNAPAERCSVHRSSLGHRFVRYRGRDYIIMGLYYEPRLWTKPRAFFVLRRVDGGDRAPVPAWSGERRKLRRGHVVRAGVYALIIIILLTLPVSIASKPRALVPPAAQRVAPLTMPGVPTGSREAGVSRSTPQRGGAVDRHPAPAMVGRTGRAGMSRPPRRLRHAATRARSTTVAFYAVSFGTFPDRWQAGEVVRRVRAMGYRATASPAGVSVRVRGHRYPTRANAARMVRILRSIGLPASVEVANAG